MYTDFTLLNANSFSRALKEDLKTNDIVLINIILRKLINDSTHNMSHNINTLQERDKYIEDTEFMNKLFFHKTVV